MNLGFPKMSFWYFIVHHFTIIVKVVIIKNEWVCPCLHCEISVQDSAEHLFRQSTGSAVNLS